MPSMRNTFAAFAALALAASLTACGGGAYRAAGVRSLPATEVAVLEHHDPAHSTFIISHVDGKSRGIGIFREYVLAPGEHAIRLTAAMPLGEPTPGALIDRSLVAREPVEAVFDAEAGKRYVIDVVFDVPGQRWGAFVTDKATGRIVSTQRAVAK